MGTFALNFCLKEVEILDAGSVSVEIVHALCESWVTPNKPCRHPVRYLSEQSKGVAIGIFIILLFVLVQSTVQSQPLHFKTQVPMHPHLSTAMPLLEILCEGSLVRMCFHHPMDISLLYYLPWAQCCSHHTIQITNGLSSIICNPLYHSILAYCD